MRIQQRGLAWVVLEQSMSKIANLRFAVLLFVFVFGSQQGVRAAAGQCPGQPTDGSIAANPNRPTISDPADITQYGVLEAEYGYEPTWEGSGQRLHDFGGLFKFAVRCDLELRWTNDLFQRQVSPGNHASGSGDHMLGFQYRYHHQTARLPTLSFRYEAKIPVASVSKGLGSGQVDHFLTAMASKDLGKTHFDFNVGYLLAGRPTGHAFDTNYNLALAFSHPLRGKWGITGEGYGESTLNQNALAYASTLWGVTYAVTPRLVLDGGMDFGLTHYAPQKHVFVGVTYAIADVYRAWHKLNPPAPDTSGRHPATPSH